MGEDNNSKKSILSDTAKRTSEIDFIKGVLDGTVPVSSATLKSITEHLERLQIFMQKRELEEEKDRIRDQNNSEIAQIENDIKGVLEGNQDSYKSDVEMPEDIKKAAAAETSAEKNEAEKLARQRAEKEEFAEKHRKIYMGIVKGKDYFKEENAPKHKFVSEEEVVRFLKERKLPVGWKNAFSDDSNTLKTHAETCAEAMMMSLTNLGKVDIEYISSVTGKKMADCLDELKGAVFQNPLTWDRTFYKGWETAEEYLSGNISFKMRIALAANEKYNGYFNDNIEALRRQVKSVPSSSEIYAALGSPWIPTDVIDSFISHLLGPNYLSRTVNGRVTHDHLTGTWEVPEKGRYAGNALSYTKYGTYRMETLQIIEKTLNQKPIVIRDEETDYTSSSGVRYVINRAETLLALEKQEVICREFANWIWDDPKRKERLTRIYGEKYGCIKKRIYDGRFLRFHGMNPDVEIYDYQKNAIARILFSKNTLLAHDVGSGKTYIMVAAAMEMKKMGISSKNMIVVPNNIVGQWENIFTMLYPNAKILAIEPKLFTPSKRQSVLKDIRDNDYDAVIIAYSCFDLIKMSRDWYLYRVEEERRKIGENIKKGAVTHGIRALSKKNYKEFGKLMEKEDEDETICFDELGITRLFVDEAHNYKNVPIDTKIENIRGIKSAGSVKCALMMDKVHFTQMKNGGVIMATGTPITNSLTDAYVMQTYLQSDELERMNLQSFDGWIGMFAEKATDFEIDVDTSNYRMTTRFAKFHNLPELTALLSGISDFHFMGDSEDLPVFNGYEDVVIPKSEALSSYLSLISKRADDIRQGKVRRELDNMLKLTTDGRKAALDVRLVNEDEVFSKDLKVAKCAELVSDIYKKTNDFYGTQLVFCDISVPKEAFNVYDELKRLLKSKGIPEKEIAYIYDADTDAEKEALFGKMRDGKIRVLIGSTFKLGMGVNVQDKLYALHHLDVPWRPADMVQREGRIIRQGNTNKEVYIYRYITSGSFDAYSWQLLETKQQFITALLSGSLKQRSGSDVDDTVLNYAEVKALAVGNPLVKKRVMLFNELNRLTNLQRKQNDVRLSLEKELEEMPELIKEQRMLLNNCRKDSEHYKLNLKDYTQEERKNIRNDIFSGLENNEFAEEERKIAEYQGFDVVLPANMIKEKSFVWLRRYGSYPVEMGVADRGVLMRLDNFFENMDDMRKRLQKKLDGLILRKKKIAEELSNRRDYSEEIRKTTEMLMQIDEELGIGKNKLLND